MKMQLRVVVSDDSLIQEKANLIYDLSNQLNNYLLNRNYGEKVKKIDIGFLIVMERPGYEQWYKPKKPKYVEFKTKKSNLTGEDLVVEKTFSYEIKLNGEQFYTFTGGDELQSKSELATVILNSLSNLDVLSKKTNDFDKNKFIEDIKIFFTKQHA